MLSFIAEWCRRFRRNEERKGGVDEVGAKFERYWRLREAYLREGVYDGVIFEVLPYGAVPAFNYHEGTRVATFDASGVLVVYVLEQQRRIWVAQRDVPYEQEAEHLAALRRALPGADEYRVIWTTDGPDAQRGYWAVKYP